MITLTFNEFGILFEKVIAVYKSPLMLRRLSSNANSVNLLCSDSSDRGLREIQHALPRLDVVGRFVLAAASRFTQLRPH